MFTKAPILSYYKQGNKIFVKTDSSDYVNSGGYSQLGNDELLYPIAFFAKNFKLAKCKYKIYDKGLLAIIRYFE